MAKTSGGVRGNSHSEKLRKALKTTEGSIRRNKYESAVAYDSKGKVLLNKRGQRFSVSFDESEVAKMKDSIFTHNHPRSLGKRGMAAIGNSFSNEDIITMVTSNMKEMRAVTPTYTFSMRRPKGGWGVSVSELKASVRKISKEVTSEFTNRLNKGTTTPLKASTVHYHEVNKRLAKKYGWEYSKRRG